MRILTVADVKAVEKQMQGAAQMQSINAIELETRTIARACDIDYSTLVDLPMAQINEYRVALNEQIHAPVEMVHTEDGWEFVMAHPPSDNERCIQVRFPTRRDTVHAHAQNPSSVFFGAKLLAAIGKVDGNKRPISHWDRISYTDFRAVMDAIWAYGI